jgi:hypothetical protein
MAVQLLWVEVGGKDESSLDGAAAHGELVRLHARVEHGARCSQSGMGGLDARLLSLGRLRSPTRGSD